MDTAGNLVAVERLLFSTANTASSALPRLIEGFIVAIATLCIAYLYTRESRCPLLRNAAAFTLDVAGHRRAVLLREEHSPAAGVWTYKVRSAECVRDQEGALGTNPTLSANS